MLSVGIILVCIALSSAYKKGPPVKDHPDICTHMIPNHMSPPLTTAHPFTMTFSQDCFAASQTVKLEVTTSKDKFEGLFVQARVGAAFPNATQSYGEFRSYIKHTGQIGCFGGTKNAIGHENDEPKVTKLVIYWQAPSTGLTQDVHIGGTFLLHFKEFWVNVSKKLTYNASCKQMETGEAADKDSGASSVQLSTGLAILLVSSVMKLL